MKNNYHFKCIHCGDGFNLNDEDDELFSEGHFMYEPDTCDECGCHNRPFSEENCFSDADPGL